MPFRWRPDGDYVQDVPSIRKVMPLIMRGRNESTIFFEQKVDVRKTWPFLHSFREQTGLHVTMLHLIIWAAAQTLEARPHLNRFVAGRRIFQRRGIWVSFSIKKEKSDDFPVVVVKRRINPSWRFEELARRIEEGIQEGRSDRPSSTDMELAVLFKFPMFIADTVVRLEMLLDHFGLLPGFMIRSDPLFASVFIANLGSIGMAPPFHHLYEYGTISVFAAVGKSRDEMVIGADGEPTVRTVMTIRYSFDERITDGLYCLQALEMFKQMLEDPAAAIRAGNRGEQDA